MPKIKVAFSLAKMVKLKFHQQVFRHFINNNCNFSPKFSKLAENVACPKMIISLRKINKLPSKRVRQKLVNIVGINGRRKLHINLSHRENRVFRKSGIYFFYFLKKCKLFERKPTTDLVRIYKHILFLV